MDGRANNTGTQGNSGGKPYSEENRKKAATLKGLVLDWATKIMLDPEIPFKDKNEVVMKILPTCMPREVELGNNDLGPLQIQIISYDKQDAINHNPVQLDTRSASTSYTDQSS